MNEEAEKNNLFHIPSCTIEEAVMYLLGFSEISIKPVWIPPSLNSPEGEWLDSAGFDLLEDLINLAESELQDAKNDKCPEEVIKQKKVEFDRCSKLIQDARFYQQAIHDEINSGAALQIDKLRTKTPSRPFITSISLKRWAHEVLQISILDDLHIPIPVKAIKPVKPPSKMFRQRNAILDEIKKLGYDPKSLPKPTWEKGVKAAVKLALVKHALFEGETNFKRAWEDLSNEGDIVINK